MQVLYPNLKSYFLRMFISITEEQEDDVTDVGDTSRCVETDDVLTEAGDDIIDTQEHVVKFSRSSNCY